MKKYRSLILPIVIAVFIVAGPLRTAKAEQVIKIGAILNLTGPNAFIGPLFKSGIQKALEESNYSVAGKKIKLIVEDAANDMNVTLEKTRKLVERDRVHIILGPLMGDAQLATAPYLANKKVLSTTLYCGSIELAKKYKGWLIYPNTLVGIMVPAGQFAASKGYKTMITVGADYAGGRGFIEGIKLGFEEKGGKVIQQVWVPVGTNDFGPYLNSLKKADCVAYFLEGPSPAERFLVQYKQFGMKMPLVGTGMAAQLIQPILKHIGNDIVGLEGQAHYLANMKDPLNQKWVKEMTDEFGQVPGAFQVNSYSLTRAIIAGLEATGGNDSFDQLWPAMMKVKIETPQGPLSFRPDGIAITNGYIVKVVKKDGKFSLIPIKTYERVTDPRLKK